MSQMEKTILEKYFVSVLLAQR